MNNQNMEIFSFANPVVPAYEFFDCYGVGLIESNDTLAPKKTSDSSTDIKVKLLKVVRDNQMLPSSEYPKLAGISPNTFQKIRRLLLEEGLIHEHKFQMTGRGRSRLVLSLTQKGKNLLKNHDSNQEVD